MTQDLILGMIPALEKASLVAKASTLDRTVGYYKLYTYMYSNVWKIMEEVMEVDG